MSTGSPEDSIKATVSSDKMTATLSIAAGADPAMITKQLCLTALTDANVMVTHEIDGAVASLVEAVNASPGEAIERVVATGLPPVHGEDERLVFEEEFDPTTLEEEMHERESGGGSDFYSLVSYRLANEGDLIAKVHPAVSGQDGMTVTGDTLAAKSAKPLGLSLDDSVMVKGDGTVVAMGDGVVQYVKGKLSVLPQLTVDENVDFSTGNIEFDGDVLVKKSVKDCFEVTAARSITVQGLVEAATLRSGTDLILASGMAAREKGVIEAERDVKARYLDSVAGFVGRHCEIDKEVVNCEISVGGRFSAERGAIIGGHMRLCGVSDVGALGSEMSAKTTVTLGRIAGFDVLREQIEELSPNLEAALEKVQSEHEMLDQNKGGLTADQNERMTELQFKVSSIQSLLKRLEAAQAKLNDAEDQFAETDLTVQSRIHPGVTLRLGEYIAEFETSVKGPVRITLNASGRPVMVDLVGGVETDLRERARVVERESHGKTGSMAA